MFSSCCCSENIDEVVKMIWWWGPRESSSSFVARLAKYFTYFMFVTNVDIFWCVCSTAIKVCHANPQLIHSVKHVSCCSSNIIIRWRLNVHKFHVGSNSDAVCFVCLCFWQLFFVQLFVLVSLGNQWGVRFSPTPFPRIPYGWFQTRMATGKSDPGEFLLNFLKFGSTITGGLISGDWRSKWIGDLKFVYD